MVIPVFNKWSIIIINDNPSNPNSHPFPAANAPVSYKVSTCFNHSQGAAGCHHQFDLISAGAGERRCALKILHRRQYLAQVADGGVCAPNSKNRGETGPETSLCVCVSMFSFFIFWLLFLGYRTQFMVAWGLNFGLKLSKWSNANRDGFHFRSLHQWIQMGSTFLGQAWRGKTMMFQYFWTVCSSRHEGNPRTGLNNRTSQRPQATRLLVCLGRSPRLKCSLWLVTEWRGWV